MDRIDRLKRKAVEKAKCSRKSINEAVKEIEDYITYRKAHPMISEEREEYQQFIEEMEAQYG